MDRLFGSIRFAMLFLVAAIFVGCAQAERGPETKIDARSSAVVPADFDVLTGAPWKGELTYLDYDRKVPRTIKSTLSVARMAGGPDGATLWNLRFGYTDEPHADGSEIAALSANGRDFRGEQVVERLKSADEFSERYIYRWSR